MHRSVLRTAHSSRVVQHHFDFSALDEVSDDTDDDGDGDDESAVVSGDEVAGILDALAGTPRASGLRISKPSAVPTSSRVAPTDPDALLSGACVVLSRAASIDQASVGEKASLSNISRIGNSLVARYKESLAERARLQHDRSATLQMSPRRALGAMPGSGASVLL